MIPSGDVGVGRPSSALRVRVQLFGAAGLRPARRLLEAMGDGLRVLFLHPDLGLGGAERLVVDAAVALAGRGHRVPE